MKFCLYLLSMMTIIMSLAACGKAVSSCETEETEEIHRAYVIEDEEPIEVAENEITVCEDKLNIGFLQSSNLELWQVMQTESFYMAFAECDGYHLNILDAHGDAEKQNELFMKCVDAQMDVMFIVLIDSDTEEAYRMAADAAGVKVFFLKSSEEGAVGGDEARKLLENEESFLKDLKDKKR